ncbi:MAG TPA: EamA family transporter [Lachnospiraceae bacterium]|nr:EamA family transporter [Lachnospiraceae bacterium]
MSSSLIWPIVLIVLSNVIYNICSKETPSGINPFAALSVTYIVGAFFSIVLYFLLNRGGNLLHEYRNLNWSSFILGLAVVGLEAGSIYMYKAGWNVSSGQLVYSVILAVCLILIGVFAYHESISMTKIIGILVCMFGLFLISK